MMENKEILPPVTLNIQIFLYALTLKKAQLGNGLAFISGWAFSGQYENGSRGRGRSILI